MYNSLEGMTERIILEHLSQSIGSDEIVMMRSLPFFMSLDALFAQLAILDNRVFLFPEDYERYKKAKRFPDSEFIMAHEH